MRINKRKVLLWIVCALAAVAFVLVIANLIQMHRNTRRLEALRRRRGEVTERIARLATQFDAAIPPAPPSAVSGLSAAPPPAPFSRSELTRELAAIDNELWQGQDGTLCDAPKRGLGGLILYLPAAEFPGEGRSGALPGGPTLRERIRKEVQMRDLFTPPPAAHSRITSATLAARARALLDRTAGVLRRPWGAADPTTLGLSMAYGSFGFSFFAPLAVEREARAGRAEETHALLESLVRNFLLLRMGGSPAPDPWHSIQRTIFHMTEQGWLDDAVLARLDRMLAQAHLNESQLADLRAAWALQIVNMFEDGLKKEEITAASGADWRQNMRGALLKGARVFLENTLYAALEAWAAGDGAAYDRALKGPLALTFVLPKVQVAEFCPPAMSAFDGGESAGNDDIDLLRLVVAAARYRLAWGRYPARVEDLVPRYLDPAFNAPGPSLRAIDWVRNEDQKTSAAAAARPIFYVARRLTMTPLRSRLSFYFDFASRDATGMNDPTLVGQWLYPVNSAFGAEKLNLMSSRRAEAIAVRIIWPRTEDVDLDWLDGL